MRIALVADAFPPLRSSGAVQLRDLSREFIRQGHSLCVLLPEPEQDEAWRLEEFDGVQVLRLKAPRTKDIGYVRRTLAEFFMPLAMARCLRKSPLADEVWDGVVWYSPSIFHGPLVSRIKNSSRCKSYLIIRDIFPEWAVDMGLMGRGLPYHFFSLIAHYQYSLADTIGVQTPGNLGYFNDWKNNSAHRLEVLNNWLDEAVDKPCSIQISKTLFAGRKIFVYAGNMGIAQGMDIILDLAERMLPNQEVGFLFVGRGSDAERLRRIALERGLLNVIFFDEIHPDEIPNLYAQCAVGLVALDARHKSHNIPGKFLTYMQSGLPVLANVNAGNDLASLIRSEQVGQVCESNQIEELHALADVLLQQLDGDASIVERCRKLFSKEFSVTQAVTQILAAFNAKDK